eukprot:6207454-Pleurochrysis_carterae.AAC.4
MQRTINAGPSRRLLSLFASGDFAGRVHVLVMHVGKQRFCEDVRHVLARVDFADLDASVRDVLSNLQVAPIDVPRALAATPVLRQFDGARVVHVHRRRTHFLAPHLLEQPEQVDDLGRCVRCRHDFGLGRRERDAVLAL